MKKQMKNNKARCGNFFSLFTFHSSPLKAFTLAEVMITMALLGVLAAIAIPAVMKVKPDSRGVMFKKAYSTLEKTVSDLINNDLYYPSTKVTPTDCTSPTMPNGTACGFAYTATTTNMGIPNGLDKFNYTLIQELNTAGSAVDADKSSLKLVFTTTDGIAWYLSNSSFTVGATNYKYIGVDVNGPAKGDDCINIDGGDVPIGLFTTCSANQVPDHFVFEIRYDGKIKTCGTLESDYLKNPTKNHL